MSVGHIRWLSDGSYLALIFKPGLSAARRVEYTVPDRNPDGELIALPGCTVAHPGHRGRPEHRRQTTLVLTLNPGVRHLLAVHHLRLALLTHRLQIQTVLQQLPQQLPALTGQPFLQLGVGLPVGRAPAAPRSASWTGPLDGYRAAIEEMRRSVLNTTIRWYGPGRHTR